MPDQSNSTQAEKVWSLVKSIRIAMLCTHHADGFGARPMYALVPDQNDLIWFITDRDTMKVAEVLSSSEVLLTFSSGGGGDHVVIRGEMTIDYDRNMLESLWNPGATIFFPKGPKDDSAILLRFAPVSAEYWSGSTGLLAFALDFMSAKITGTRPDTGQHGHVNL